MSLFKRNGGVVARCDSCEQTYTQDRGAEVELVHLEGFDVVRCVDPVTCRERAQAKGIWKTYEPQR